MMTTTKVEPLAGKLYPGKQKLTDNTTRETWQDEKDQKPQLLWSFRFTTFMQEISIIGIKYVFNSGLSTLRRIIWLSLILFGFGFMFFQLQERIRYFMTFDTTTRTRMIHKEKIRYPTVTICNENRFELQKILQTSKYV